MTRPIPDLELAPQTLGNCLDCLYWKRSSDYGAEGAYETGECRVFAPAPAVANSRIWAVTKSTDWCGNFQKRVVAGPLPAEDP